MFGSLSLGLSLNGARKGIVLPINLPPAVPIGVNLALNSNSYFGHSYPFLDRFKTAAMHGNGCNWEGYNADFSTNPTPPPMDADGWPTGLPSGAIGMRTQIGLDRSVEGQIATYRLRYEGTTPAVGGTVTGSSPGEIMFTNTRTGDGINDSHIQISVPAPGNISNVTVVRTDQAALLDSGEIFNPAFLAIAAPWKIIRFMDWLATNVTTVTTWASRPTLSSASWNPIVPIEVCVALCNKLGADAWFNIPHAATDDFVQRAAEMIRTTLNPGRRVTFEYGNELWNWAYLFHVATGYVRDLWEAEFGADSAAYAKGAGWRAAQVADIIATEFAGQEHRLTNVLGMQTGFLALNNHKKTGVAADGGATVRERFATTAITAYFGGTLSGYNAADRATILGWADMGAAGLDLAFEEIEHGGLLTAPRDDIDYGLSNYIEPQIAWARANGVDVQVYEAGFHITSKDFPAGADFDKASAFHVAIANDPRSGALYDRMAREGIERGVQAFPIYVDIGPASAEGIFGMQTSPYRAETPRYTAMKALALNSPAPMALELTATPPVAVVGTSPVVAPSAFGGIIPRSPITLVGSLPPGRSWNGVSETGAYTAPGAYDYAYRVTDARGVTVTLPMSGTVAPAPAILYQSNFNAAADNTNLAATYQNGNDPVADQVATTGGGIAGWFCVGYQGNETANPYAFKVVGGRLRRHAVDSADGAAIVRDVGRTSYRVAVPLIFDASDAIPYRSVGVAMAAGGYFSDATGIRVTARVDSFMRLEIKGPAGQTIQADMSQEWASGDLLTVEIDRATQKLTVFRNGDAIGNAAGYDIAGMNAASRWVGFTTGTNGAVGEDVFDDIVITEL